MKNLLNVLLASFLVVSLTACKEKDTDSNETNSVEEIKYQEYLKDTNPVVEINFKDFGTIELQLFPEVCRNTVNNFLSYARSGFYDGLTMHRIIKDFMIQGGDPSGDGTGGTENKIVGEFNSNGYQNNLSHFRGVISMARTNDPNSATSQFFIVHKDSKHLDGEYASFGGMTKGFDVLDKIANVKTDYKDMPETPVVIESVKVIKDLEKIEEPVYYNPDKTYSNEVNEVYLHDASNPVASIKLSNEKQVNVELMVKKAPKAVNTFIELVNNGSFNGKSFMLVAEQVAVIEQEANLLYEADKNDLAAYKGALGFQHQIINGEQGKTANLNLMYNSHSFPGAEMIVSYFGFIFDEAEQKIMNDALTSKVTIKEISLNLNGFKPSTTTKYSLDFVDSDNFLSSDNKQVKLTLNNGESFVIELFNEAPKSSEAFLNSLKQDLGVMAINDGYFIQSTIVNLDQKLEAETVNNAISNNIKNDKYSVMIYLPTIFSGNEACFVINLTDNASYNGVFGVFGKVVSGTEVIDKLSTSEVDKQTGEPVSKINIITAEVLK